MAATSEIRLYFLDIETDEHRLLNGDITQQVNPAGNKRRHSDARRNTHWPLFCCLYAPETGSTAKIENSLGGSGEVVDCQPTEHPHEDHMVPVVAAPGAVNGVRDISTGPRCTHKS
jgi:hypothetical protein